MTGEVHLDPDLFYPDPARIRWHDFVEDIDELLEFLGSPRVLRQIVYLRLHNLSVAGICLQLGMSQHRVHQHLDVARRLLVYARVVETESKSGSLTGSRPQPGSKVYRGSSYRSGVRYRRTIAQRRGAVPPEARTFGSETPAGLHSPGLPVRDGAERQEEQRAAHRTFAERHRTLCPCCEKRLRPLNPVQSFGWRQVYYNEVHRTARR